MLRKILQNSQEKRSHHYKTFQKSFSTEHVSSFCQQERENSNLWEKKKTFLREM